MDNPLLEKAIEDFDLENFLEENNLDYKTEGKNIGNGWIGLFECPWCGITNFHFAIHANNKTTNCWNCLQGKGNLIQFVAKILNISFDDASEFILGNSNLEDSELEFDQQLSNIFKPKYTKDIIKKEPKIDLPNNIKITKSLIEKNKIIRNFLKLKRIDYKDCISNDLRIGLEGIHKNKLILPIYFNNKLVAYQTRNLIYKIFHNEGNIHNYLYKLDLIPKYSKILLVEGFYDYNSTYKFLTQYKKKYFVTTGFFKKLTDTQIDLIHSIKPKEIIFFLDKDAWHEYNLIADKLICSTSFIIPNKKDPGLMATKDFIKVFYENNL